MDNVLIRKSAGRLEFQEMFRSLSKFVPVLMLLLVFGSASARAQNGRILGQITDPKGKPVAGAAVEVDNQEGTLTRSAKTDASGAYSVPDLPPGTYLIVITADGFNPFTSPAQTLAAGLELTFNSQVIPVEQQSVEVKAGGPASIELDTATLSGTISGKEVHTLALNGRNFSQLITNTPGVSNQTGQDEAKVGIAGSAKFSVNGGRVEYNTFEIDRSDVLNTGINASRGQGEPLIVYPSIDAIQDIQVMTSNYDAQYGKTASGTVLVTTKSGTADFHGNLYGFIRNEMFNARNYFDAPGRTPLYRRQDYGGTIGGPLFIPGRYNIKKDKTFFFFSEELRLEKTPVAYNQAVPTAAERSGNFSDVCPPSALNGSIYYPGSAYPDCPVAGATGVNAYPGFVNARVNVNYAAAAMLATNTIPLPNSNIGCNTTNPTPLARCYIASVSPATYWREELFRIDHNLTPSQQLSFRYVHDAWNTTTLTPQWGVVQNSFPTVENKLNGPGLDMVVNLTETLPHGFLNRVTLAYSVSHISLAPEPGPGVTSLARPSILDAPCQTASGVATSPPGPNSSKQVLTECAMGYIFNNGFGGKMPGLIFQGNNGAYGGHGFAADTGYAPWNMANPTYVIRDDVSKAIGKHTLQFGVEATLVQQNELSAVSGANSGDIQGLLTFSNQQSRNTSNNAFADFVAGPGIVPVVPDAAGDATFQEWGDGTTAIKTFTQDSGQGRYYDRYKVAELYAQDSWRMTSRLTLNLGFRASLFGSWYNAKNTAYNWEPQAYNQALGSSAYVDPTNGFLVRKAGVSPVPLSRSGPYSLSNLDPVITNGLVQCGVNGVPNSCLQSHIFNPAPRAGLAWDPFGTGRTSIRAGYGLFWEHGTSYEANTGSLIGGAPLILSETESYPGGLQQTSTSEKSNGVSPGGYNLIGFSCQQGASQCGSGVSYPGGVTFPLNVTSIPTKAVYSYTQQWSLSVQRQLNKDIVGTMAYVGSKGTHLSAERDLNQLQPLDPGQNSFPAGQPLTADICQAGANSPTGTFPVGGTNAGNGSVTSPGIGPGQPGYVNLLIACTGSPGFVSIASNSRLGTSADSVRPYNGFSNILAVQNVADSNYSGLQATLRRTAGALTLGMAYTYSHSLDDASDRASANFVNSLNLKSNYASSDFDERQLLSVDYIYDLPLIKLLDRFTQFANEDESAPAGSAPAESTKTGHDWRDERLVRNMLDHWQFSGITAYITGTPFSVVNEGSANGVAAADNAGVGNAVGLGSYPDRVGSAHGVKPNAPSTGSANGATTIGPLLLNPSAFAAPRGLTFGNAGRNSVNNPNRTNFNMSLLKHFSAFSEQDLEFRAEFFNVFNHTQFRIYDPTHPGNTGNNVVNCYGDITTGYNAGATTGSTNCVAGNSFLHPVDAHDPRIMQFGLKLAF